MVAVTDSPDPGITIDDIAYPDVDSLDIETGDVEAGDEPAQGVDAAAEGTQTPAEGQESDSPADEEAEGDEPEADDDESAEPKKPAPYDKDPKWKRARAAEKALNDLLGKSGYESTEELLADLQEGKSLKELVGDRDAKRIVEQANKLDEYEKIWAADRERQQRENESPEETIERLEGKLKEQSESQARQLADQREASDAAKAIEAFTGTVTKVVNATEGLSEHGKTLAKQILSIENPIIDIDITDAKAVRDTAAKMMADLSNTIKAIEKNAIDRVRDQIRQDAINEYADGKSKIVPTKKADVQSSATSIKDRDFHLSDDVNNISDAFDEMSGNLIDILSELAQ